MKSLKGIENPAFVASSPDTPRRVCASSPSIEISVLPTPAAGSPPPPAPQEPPERPEPPQPSGVPGASGPGSLSEYEEGPCGWGSFQPRALQRCNTPRGFLFHYCLLALTQGIVVNGLVNISISTIEKRYELQSSLTGLISSSYDIAFCLLSLFVSFIGERGHKPRWLAFASFMIGLGALVFSLPKFFSGKYQFGSLFEDTCSTAKNKHSCSTSSSPLFYYLYVFILGQLLLGTGGTPLYTLGTAFIDDSVPIHKSSLYIVLSTCSEALITTGFATFLPKFIENQFGMSSSSAATLAGTVLIPGAALGQILGGILVSKFKMTCKNIMKFALLTSVISLVLTFVFAYANCENEPFAGTIPGPIIFGSTIDSTCILWDINECGSKGACWIYNNVRMAYMLVAINHTNSNHLKAQTPPYRARIQSAPSPFLQPPEELTYRPLSSLLVMEQV
ncbi:hypothetical protein MJG53_007877 [Ovis ammon polii x Ovis aries]|uniref:Uncharacterized protein n=1 Tax=Ovis ammon polii x Ovis aries TaxID=2918886 RepID=A0ACB9V453_9CETA|nr:hypothetical protein MJG53_007877 [Ovis ammon polii x Ovis aries]